MKVAVIGAGLIGGSLAYRLSQYGVEVLLLDGGDPVQQASSGSVAWVNASSKAPGPYFDLARAGMIAYDALADEFASEAWLHRSGHLLWSDSSDKTRHFRQRVAHLRDGGYQIAMRSARAVADEFEPNVRFPDPDHPVVYSREESWVDVPLLIEDLVQRAAELGVQAHRRSSVEHIELADDSVVGVRSSDGRHWAVDAVVNAAGAAAGRVGGLIGKQLPMQYSPGLVVRLHVPEPVVHTIMHAPGVVIRPESNSRVLLHSKRGDDLLRSTVVQENDQAVDAVIAAALEIVPELRDHKRMEAGIWARPIPEDGLPSVGRLRGVTGYYEAVAHNGVTLAPVIADLLAGEIAKSESHPALKHFRPDRFDRNQRPAGASPRQSVHSAGGEWNN